MASVPVVKAAGQSTDRRDQLVDIERKVRKMWADAKVYETDAPADESKEKNKFLATFPYPYMNGVLHLGHAFTLSKAEFAVRYQRLRGKHVLFPFGFHCTGMPIAACSDRLKREVAAYGNPPVFPDEEGAEEEADKEAEGDNKDESVPEEVKEAGAGEEKKPKVRKGRSKVGSKKSKQSFQWNIMREMGVPQEEISKFQDPFHWLKYFPPIGKADLELFGLSADFRRSFITTDVNPYYDAFIRWQFNTLIKKEKVKFGARLSIFSPVDNQPCADHDRASGEGVGPQEYVLIKIQLLKPYPKSIEAMVSGDVNVYLPAATLRPETMYGQTNCFVLPEGKYGVYQINKSDVYICSDRSASNMSYQNIMEFGFGKLNKLGSVAGQELIGSAVKAPLCTYEKVYVLPLLTISMNKGTGVVTSVPSDAPDDYAALMDLKNKPKMREKFALEEHMVIPFEVVPIINIPGLGNQAAADLCVSMKVASQNDKVKLEAIKEKTYLEGFNKGIMLVGEFKDQKVSVAKPLIRDQMVKNGTAVIYSEPESVVMSRSGVECVVALTDQWYLTYGEDKWKALVKDHINKKLKVFNPKTKERFDATVDWLHEWGCSRSYGLGTKLPCDPKFVVESLSDSTVYMAYYTIAHFLQGAEMDGSQPGLAKASADKYTDDVFNYIFLHKDHPTYPSTCGIPQSELDKMRGEFEYWYPVDIRVSGKDLIGNHLTMSLYNHAAVWEKQPEMWPQAFFTNGHLMIDSQKMSKSTGNFLTLRDCIAKYGADATRFALCDSGDSLEDANFGNDIANQAILRLTKEATWIEETVAEQASLREGEYSFWDEVFLNEINSAVQQTTEAYDTMKFMNVMKFGIYDLSNSRDVYRNTCAELGMAMHKNVVKRYLDVFLVLISPVCPFWSQHMWTVAGHKGFILDATWPTYDAIDKLLTVKVSYLRDCANAFRAMMTKAQQQVAKRSKADFKTILFKELKVVVAATFPKWQTQVLELLTGLYKENKNQLPDNRVFAEACKKAFASHPDKKMVKNAMAFGGEVRTDFELRGEAALDTKMPFDEFSFLQTHVAWVTKGLKVTTKIESVSFEDETAEAGAGGALPGKPGCFYAL